MSIFPLNPRVAGNAPLPAALESEAAGKPRAAGKDNLAPRCQSEACTRDFNLLKLAPRRQNVGHAHPRRHAQPIASGSRSADALAMSAWRVSCQDAPRWPTLPFPPALDCHHHSRCAGPYSTVGAMRAGRTLRLGDDCRIDGPSFHLQDLHDIRTMTTQLLGILCPTH